MVGRGYWAIVRAGEAAIQIEVTGLPPGFLLMPADRSRNSFTRPAMPSWQATEPAIFSGTVLEEVAGHDGGGTSIVGRAGIACFLNVYAPGSCSCPNPLNRYSANYPSAVRELPSRQ